jgi:hypothetical protein
LLRILHSPSSRVCLDGPRSNNNNPDLGVEFLGGEVFLLRGIAIFGRYGALQEIRAGSRDMNTGGLT